MEAAEMSDNAGEGLESFPAAAEPLSPAGRNLETKPLQDLLLLPHVPPAASHQDHEARSASPLVHLIRFLYENHMFIFNFTAVFS